MKVKSESEVAQSCPTLCDPMDCSLPGSSVHGIFQAKSTGVGCHCLLRNSSYLEVNSYKSSDTLPGSQKSMLGRKELMISLY